MLNCLRMDCRRLLRSRGFYILLGVTAGLILMLVFLVSVMVDPGFLSEMQAGGAEIDAFDRRMSEEIRSLSQLGFVHECLGSGFLLVMTGLGMALFVGSDFSSGYMKNICAAIPCRSRYVLSKVLLAGIYSGILTVLAVTLSLLAPLLFHLRPAADPLFGIMQYTLLLWLPNWAFGLMALALVLLTRSPTLGIIMALVSGGGLPAALLKTAGRLFGWPPVEQYFLSSVVRELCAPQAGMAGVILICSLIWGAVYGAGGLLLISRQDI